MVAETLAAHAPLIKGNKVIFQLLRYYVNTTWGNLKRKLIKLRIFVFLWTLDIKVKI